MVVLNCDAKVIVAEAFWRDAQFLKQTPNEKLEVQQRIVRMIFARGEREERGKRDAKLRKKENEK